MAQLSAMDRALAVVEKTAFSHERYTPQGFTKAIAEAVEEAVKEAIERNKPVADEYELALREILHDLDVQGMTQRRFPGVHPLDGWFGKATIVPYMPGQLPLMVVFIDATFCESGQYDLGKGEKDQPWQFWVAHMAFDRREMKVAGARLPELVARKLASAMNHWQQTYLGAMDQITIYDDFTDLTLPMGQTMPQLRSPDEIYPDAIAGEK